jgi:hypothetical protein
MLQETAAAVAMEPFDHAGFVGSQVLLLFDAEGDHRDEEQCEITVWLRS